MKVSRNAINQFRKVCNNESKTARSEVIYKIIRDLELGEVVTVTGEESFIVGFGILRILCEKGIVKSVWKDETKSYKVDRYRKYTYDFNHRGAEWANAKYQSNI